MSATAMTTVPWWKEPTKEQWHAWIAAWLGWTLDAFDFSIFLLIMLPISQDFNVPLTAVTAVFTITLWLRLAGATAAGWLSDRIGRKKPLMISILWYSICSLLAGIAPSFGLLFLFRALLGIGMGAEWPCGAALAMETWPQRHAVSWRESYKRHGELAPCYPVQRMHCFTTPLGGAACWSWGPAGAGGRLYPPLRQRAGTLDAEPGHPA